MHGQLLIRKSSYLGLNLVISAISKSKKKKQDILNWDNLALPVCLSIYLETVY